MSRFTVGAVPFLNAKPILFGLETSGVQVHLEVPSQLPLMLQNSAAQAVLVSSIEALRYPEARVVDSVSISSLGRVASVRMFSKVPFNQIQTLALDMSSMTSNALAQILLAELFDCHPKTSTCNPELETMLAKNDAAILIGDNGLSADSAGMHVLDLGAAWTEMTGLPFVWAVWLGGSSLTSELAEKLVNAKEEGLRNLDSIIEGLQPSNYDLHDYFHQCIDFELNSEHKKGLAKFGELLIKHQLLESVQMPHFVAGTHAQI